MRYLPSSSQWRNWSLPSRLTAIGAAISVVSLIVAVVLALLDQAADRSRARLMEEEAELRSRLESAALSSVQGKQDEQFLALLSALAVLIGEQSSLSSRVADTVTFSGTGVGEFPTGLAVLSRVFQQDYPGVANDELLVEIVVGLPSPSGQNDARPGVLVQIHQQGLSYETNVFRVGELEPHVLMRALAAAGLRVSSEVAAEGGVWVTIFDPANGKSARLRAPS